MSIAWSFKISLMVNMFMVGQIPSHTFNLKNVIGILEKIFCKVGDSMQKGVKDLAPKRDIAKANFCDPQ